MTIEDEILQYLHYHPLSNRVEITLGITNPPSGRIVKRDIPKIIKFKATTSLRVSCLFCIFKHSVRQEVV